MNVILPWLWARAAEGKSATLQREIERRYFGWPAGEDNAVLKLARQRLLGTASRRALRSAAAQQGLMQIVRDFCAHSNAICDHCRLPECVAGLTQFRPGERPTGDANRGSRGLCRIPLRAWRMDCSQIRPGRLAATETFPVCGGAAGSLLARRRCRRRDTAFHRIRIFPAFISRQRADHHVDAAPDELRLKIGMAEGRDGVEKFFDDLKTEFLVRHFPPAKFERDLHLHILAQKADRVLDFDARDQSKTPPSG